MKQFLIQTFDDGPSISLTPRILDVLAEEKAKAIFFVLGEKVVSAESKRIMRRALSEGHRIGNHSFSHPRLTDLTADEIRDELLRTEDMIGEFLTADKLFRPPYGLRNSVVDEVTATLGYTQVLWTIDPEDWNPANQPLKWIDLAVNGIVDQPQGVLLCHDTLESTVCNYPFLISRMKERGNVEWGDVWDAELLKSACPGGDGAPSRD